MGTLVIEYDGKRKEYLINTRVLPHVMDKCVEDILKYYPSDAFVDFIENEY